MINIYRIASALLLMGWQPLKCPLAVKNFNWLAETRAHVGAVSVTASRKILDPFECLVMICAFVAVSEESWQGHDRASHLHHSVSVVLTRGRPVLQLLPVFTTGEPQPDTFIDVCSFLATGVQPPDMGSDGTYCKSSVLHVLSPQ